MICKFCKGTRYGEVDGKFFQCVPCHNKKYKYDYKSRKNLKAAKEFVNSFVDAINKIEEVKDE